VNALKQRSDRAEPRKDYPMSITVERKQELMKDFATSKNDTGSPQVQVAVLTDRIKTLTSHFGIHKKDNHSRRGMLKMVARRRKLLDYMKKHNTEAYDSIVARLGLRG
jgi:small subunit ribosomal protein S15